MTKEHAERPLIPDLAGSETVLLAEDDELVRDLVSSILHQQGYKVLVVENGQKALAAMDSRDGPIDLVLTDMNMPDMDGTQLFEHISAFHPDARALYMSADGSKIIERQDLTESGDNYLQKPFSRRKLAAKVREVLG